jgi:hypothetical protein
LKLDWHHLELTAFWPARVDDPLLPPPALPRALRYHPSGPNRPDSKTYHLGRQGQSRTSRRAAQRPSLRRPPGKEERKRGDPDECNGDEFPSPRKILGARPLEVVDLTGDGDSSDEESNDDGSGNGESSGEVSNLPWPNWYWLH